MRIIGMNLNLDGNPAGKSPLEYVIGTFGLLVSRCPSAGNGLRKKWQAFTTSWSEHL